MSTGLPSGLAATLFATERRYSADAATIWHSFARQADRYSLEDDDLFLAVATVDLMQQIVSELLAVSLVGAVAATAAPDGFWVRERASFNNSTVAVAPALRRDEFIERVVALLARHDVPERSPAGRDMRWRHAAGRAFDDAARCACRACYRCCYCMANDCMCWRGDSLEDVDDAQPRCRAGAEPELRRDAFMQWQMRSDVAWPTPTLDVLVLMAAVVVCEAVNGNAGTGYVGSGIGGNYRLYMHRSLPAFWAQLSGILLPGRTPIEMHAYNAVEQHVVCRCALACARVCSLALVGARLLVGARWRSLALVGARWRSLVACMLTNERMNERTNERPRRCPSCPSGVPCERAEYDATHPFRRGRCPRCAESPQLCADGCAACSGTCALFVRSVVPLGHTDHVVRARRLRRALRSVRASPPPQAAGVSEQRRAQAIRRRRLHRHEVRLFAARRVRVSEVPARPTGRGSAVACARPARPRH